MKRASSIARNATCVAMGFCMLCGGGAAAAASLVMSSASPTELDRITLTVFHDDAGIL